MADWDMINQIVQERAKYKAEVDRLQRALLETGKLVYVGAAILDEGIDRFGEAQPRFEYNSTRNLRRKARELNPFLEQGWKEIPNVQWD